MKSLTRSLSILFLIPSFLEVIDTDLLLVSIPGSPLSLGRLSFILAAIINLHNFKYVLKRNRIVVSFFLIQIGLFIGAFASTDIGSNLSRTMALSLMFNAAFILAPVWKDYNIQKFLHYFFLTNFVYWTAYILGNVVTGNRIVAYSELFRNQIVVNHHISALKASISGTYLFYYYLKSNVRYRLLSYLILLLTAALCVLTESRSNSIFTMLVGAIIIYNNGGNTRNLVLTGLTIAVISLPLISFLGEQETIANRFNISDTEYQQRTTESRLVLIEYAIERIFITAPFGSGIMNIRLEYDNFRNFLAHNQYLSFSIGGGIIAFLGVLIWLSAVFRTFVFLLNKRLKASLGIILAGIGHSLLTFYITLLTVDFSGMLFFIFLSMLLMIYREFNGQKLNLS